jgi:hypothetical protein
MIIILKKNLWLGVDKSCPTCHNGYMMRNSEMRENLPNENQSHLDFESKINIL